MKAIELFEKGQTLLFAPLPGKKREAMHRAAENFFQMALELEPDMTDAMLALHLLQEDSRDAWLEQMLLHQKNFGQAREELGVRVYSFWTPLLFKNERLETRNDLLLAGATLAALHGDQKRGLELLEGTANDPDRAIVEINILFRQDDWAGVIEKTNRLYLFEENLELLLMQGIALAASEEYLDAYNALYRVETEGAFYAARYASYHLALLEDEVGNSKEALERLEHIAKRSPGYLNTDKLIKELRPTVDPFWDIVSRLD